METRRPRRGVQLRSDDARDLHPVHLQLLAIQLPCPALNRIVRLQPLNDLDSIPVRVVDEESIALGNRGCLLHLDSLSAEVLAGRLDIGDSQCKVSRTLRIRS